MKMKIKQKKYQDLEIENREKDMVQIWGEQNTNDPQVIFIERANIDKLIKILEQCAAKK